MLYKRFGGMIGEEKAVIVVFWPSGGGSPLNNLARYKYLPSLNPLGTSEFWHNSESTHQGPAHRNGL